MYRHILNKRKPSCTHIPPRVNLQVLKKDLSKETPWESYEKIHQKQFFEENNSNFKKRLIDRGHPQTLVENLLLEIKEEKEILPFVTQYQPSVSTIKEVWEKKWDLRQDQP